MLCTHGNALYLVVVVKWGELGYGAQLVLLVGVCMFHAFVSYLLFACAGCCVTKCEGVYRTVPAMQDALHRQLSAI